MRLKLKSDVFFTVGTGFRPVDLVCKSTQTRIGLSEDEAAVAMLLMEGTPAGETLLRLIQKHGVSWELTELEAYLERLEQATLLQQETPLVVGPALVPKTFEVKDTDVEQPRNPDFDDAPDTDVVEIGSFPMPEEPNPVLGRFRADLRQRQLADGSIEILNPSSGEKRRFTVDTVRLAQLFDGSRRANDIVTAAQLEGLPASRDIVNRLARKLAQHNLLIDRPTVTGPLRQVESWQDTISDSEQHGLPKIPSAAYAPTMLHQTSAPPAVSELPSDPEPGTVPGRPQRYTPRPPAFRPSTKQSDFSPSPVTHPEPQPSPPPAPPSDRPFQGEGPGESLAAALVLLRDSKYDEARQVLDTVLQRSPANEQAQTLLQLIEAEESRTEPSPRRGRLVLVSIVVVLLLCGAGALFIPVTETLEIPCQAEQIARGTVKSNIRGNIVQVAIKDGEVLREGQLVAVVANEDILLQQQLAEKKLVDLADLLRLMKTGGDEKDEEKQREVIKSLKKDLRDQCKTDDARCRLLLAAKKEALQIADQKLRHCEWEAYPDEISKVEAAIRKTKDQQAELRKKARQPLHTTQAGCVSELQKSGEVWPGDVVAKLHDARVFTVKFVHPNLKPGHTVEISLGKFSAFQTFLGKVSARDKGTVLVDVAADVSEVDFASSCKAKLSERKPLFKKLMKLVGVGN